MHSFKRFLIFLRYNLIFYRTYYVSIGLIKELNVAESPKLQEFTLKIISTNKELDDLVADGFDLHPWLSTYRKRLKKGTISLNIFADKELAHMSWVAVSKEGQQTLNEPPFKVDFENNEVLAGSYWTKLEYRGKGIAPYASYKRLEYLQEIGKVASRGVIRKDNISSLRVQAKRKDKRTWIYAEGRHIKILWWESWKETPINSEQEAVE